MPPSKQIDDEGWIHSDQLVLPPQTLQLEEIERFLQYVFRTIARKPKLLKLKETAGVVRYLKAAAVEAMVGLERHAVEQLAELIWLITLDCGQIKMAPKEEVIQFLKEHANTYLASYDIAKLVEFVQNLKAPSNDAEFFQPPKLKGKDRSASGDGPAQLQDDLTERIYAAYHALRRTQIRDARGRIATVLNEMGYVTGARSATECRWGPSEVIERVRQYEDRMVRQHGLSKADQTQKERLRNMLVDGWIHLFHSSVTVGSGRPKASQD